MASFIQAVEQLGITVGRSDLADQYLGFVNTAIRQSCQRFSFPEMKTQDHLTIGLGMRGNDLPANFKEWQNGRFCAFLDTSAGEPVPVYSRIELDRLSTAFRPALHLLYLQRGAEKYVELPAPATEDLTFLIYYFAYPADATSADLVVGTGPETSNAVLDAYYNMVMSKAFALAFQSINDDQYLKHEAQWERELQTHAGTSIKVAMPRPTEEKQ